MITFAICGSWHGEDITFLFWGILFGVYLTCSNWTEKLNKKLRKRLHVKKTSHLYILYKVLLTFSLVSLTWIFFRANTISDAFSIVQKVFTNPGKLFIPGGADVITPFYGIIAIGLLLLIEIKKEYFNAYFAISGSKSEIVRMIAYALLVFIILYFGTFGESQFIYFQF